MQKVQGILKIRFNNNELTPIFKKARLVIQSKQNRHQNLLFEKDIHTMYAHREGKGMFKK